MLKPLAVFGRTTLLVLIGIAQFLLSSRYGILIRLFAWMMGVGLLIIASAYWGSLLIAIARWLGLPVDAGETPTPLESAVQLVVVLLTLAFAIVVGIIVVRWMRQRLIPWFKELISLFER